jgi:hypothetical protein
VKKEMKDPKKIISILLILTICISIVHPYYAQQFISIVRAGGIAEAIHSNSSLSVQVIHLAPRINWYDFQYNDTEEGRWVSRLNQQIEVNNESEYRFIINVSSDQGWDKITFINLTAWYDFGNESNKYNDTKGKNINLKAQYENTSGTANFNYLWPPAEGFEISFNEAESKVVEDTLYGWEDTEARNLTFPFIPNKQFRYAPGEGEDEWNTSVIYPIDNSSYYALFNNFSWNFNISIDNTEGYTTWVTDEFGVFRYTEIISAQDPSIVGYPDTNRSVNDNGGSGNITIFTCSNGNYNLSVEIDDLTHKGLPTHSIPKENVFVRGGNRSSFRNLSSLVYLYGGGQNGMTEYRNAETNGTQVNTSKVEYACYIPIGQLAGEYTSNINYRLSTEE